VPPGVPHKATIHYYFREQRQKSLDNFVTLSPTSKRTACDSKRNESDEAHGRFSEATEEDATQ